MRHLGLYVCVCLTTFWAVCAAEEKRAPSGFTGVRGKKDLEESRDMSQTLDGLQGVGEAQESQLYEKRAPSGFLGLRGKKPFDGWISPEDLYKRVPSGFTGLRGKKEMDYDMDFDKRVPSGFLGLRGKKFYDYLPNEATYEKRPSSSNFWGVRGKREFDALYEEMKRAPDNRFFGLRGKRQPSKNSFYGIRGKKYPYDLRGKFVGVRGKKSADVGTPEYFNSNDSPRYETDLDLNQLMYVLAQDERNADDFNLKQD